MCRKKVSHFYRHHQERVVEDEAEKLPDKFETFHDGYTTFLIRLYRLPNRLGRERQEENSLTPSSPQA